MPQALPHNPPPFFRVPPGYALYTHIMYRCQHPPCAAVVWRESVRTGVRYLYTLLPVPRPQCVWLAMCVPRRHHHALRGAGFSLHLAAAAPPYSRFPSRHFPGPACALSICGCDICTDGYSAYPGEPRKMTTRKPGVRGAAAARLSVGWPGVRVLVWLAAARHRGCGAERVAARHAHLTAVAPPCPVSRPSFSRVCTLSML